MPVAARSVPDRKALSYHTPQITASIPTPRAKCTQNGERAYASDSNSGVQGVANEEAGGLVTWTNGLAATAVVSGLYFAWAYWQ
eukprot:3003925-Rhodomonas_salina.1